MKNNYFGIIVAQFKYSFLKLSNNIYNYSIFVNKSNVFIYEALNQMIVESYALQAINNKTAEQLLKGLKFQLNNTC